MGGVLTLLAFFVMVLVAIAVGWIEGYDKGKNDGINQTYQDWARRIDSSDVASRYAEDIIPASYVKPYDKPRLKFRRKHRKAFIDEHDRLKWFWNDIKKVDKPKPKKYKWTKKQTEELIKELEAEMGL